MRFLFFLWTITITIMRIILEKSNFHLFVCRFWSTFEDTNDSLSTPRRHSCSIISHLKSKSCLAPDSLDSLTPHEVLWLSWLPRWGSFFPQNLPVAYYYYNNQFWE
jgi:hypothetical protein